MNPEATKNRIKDEAVTADSPTCPKCGAILYTIDGENFAEDAERLAAEYGDTV